MKRVRKRVLLLAYACNPCRGSEPGVGWHRAVETAKYFDTWVLCKKQRNERDIKRYLAQNGDVEGLQFCFVPLSRFERAIRKIPGFFYLSYNLWHRRAYREAVKLNERFHFDLVHQANMCGFREPGYLWKLDAPFVWGPVGGTQNYPWRFLIKAGLAGAVKEGLRSIINVLQFCFSPRVREAVKRASVLMTANSAGKRSFENFYRVKPKLMLEIGLDKIINELPENKGRDKPLRILWSGVFEHRKAFHLLAMALRGLPASIEYQVRILGEGPLEKRWRRLVRKSGIEQHCRWMGWLPHDEAVAQNAWADVLVFTSLRDTAGTVLLEALGHGVPVICLDHQGCGDIVTSNCGIKIPVTTADEAVSKMRDAVISLAQDRGKLRKFSCGAVERAHEYLWSRQGERIADIYEKVMAVRTDRMEDLAKVP